ncbi:Metal-binding trascriptional regulator, contains putative Fe-S cluster and ArsR family DNA binding domain [Desulfatibacillum alkenivorans DSM 16219]|jgi:ArsR family metal-binding transcriptional regulator|uniref:Metal-binding trascriptional regulator, contains putative Fe-S cluster and ArsR family DNA binding domain n=1 Tax=Desulfatibacillum alkenivorans DSM 16219 TaxID=1121393 RepID=A0A1M6EFJ8_9BACT|nr:(Fe-S)-binding protein [Desulfatibacillum alkenivorans]SHI84244.1 Metal-binding trascriptional regulator, contains putative Fe-S cluster and ArsR family DNA binding domain [Desulfatibacillum alkenivorans DSM 16219]
MILESYSKRITRPDCNHSFESVVCIASLDSDVGDALPYLNAELGGIEYHKDPPTVMFRVNNRIIKVGAREIAINALADEAEADKILTWMINEINRVWEERDSITPCYEGKKSPQFLEILKRLPKTNCKKCGQPTCMVFANLVREGGKGAEDCPELTGEKLESLQDYLADFDFDA